MQQLLDVFLGTEEHAEINKIERLLKEILFILFIFFFNFINNNNYNNSNQYFQINHLTSKLLLGISINEKILAEMDNTIKYFINRLILFSITYKLKFQL